MTPREGGEGSLRAKDSSSVQSTSRWKPLSFKEHPNLSHHFKDLSIKHWKQPRPHRATLNVWRSKWVKNIPQLSFECRNYFLMPRNFFLSRRNFWQGPSVSAGSVKTGPSAPAARQCQLIDLCSPPPASAIQLASYMPSWTQKQASN